MEGFPGGGSGEKHAARFKEGGLQHLQAVTAPLKMALFFFFFEGALREAMCDDVWRTRIKRVPTCT